MTISKPSLAYATSNDPRRNRDLIDETHIRLDQTLVVAQNNGDRMALLSHEERHCLREWIDAESTSADALDQN
jgi:hypothetical protein